MINEKSSDGRLDTLNLLIFDEVRDLFPRIKAIEIPFNEEREEIMLTHRVVRIVCIVVFQNFVMFFVKIAPNIGVKLSIDQKNDVAIFAKGHAMIDAIHASVKETNVDTFVGKLLTNLIHCVKIKH